jgi:hypothetical protein
MRILGGPPLLQMMIDEKQLENVEYLRHLGTMITSVAKCTLKLNCHDKISVQQEVDSFHQQTGLKFKEETSQVLHLGYSILWF